MSCAANASTMQDTGCLTWIKSSWIGVMQKTVASRKSLFYRRRSPGAVAQLGERVVRNDEVSGSIPLGSTRV